MSTYSIYEARNGLSKLIAQSRAGTEVVIANRGRPVARVVPIMEGESDRSGTAVAAWLEAHALAPRLMRSAEALDEQIAENRGAWE